MDTNEFIRRAKLKHGNKYNYSQVKYVNRRSKIIIICSKHGQFIQIAGNHIRRGHGCPNCAKVRIRLTLKKRYKNYVNNYDTPLFIKRARLKHGNKYDYSSTVYKNKRTKVTIICPIHGKFKQYSWLHISGSECPKCGSINGHNKLRKSTKSFIMQAKKTHGDRYDYSEAQYVDCRTKVKIICKKHGVFIQRPSNHVHGANCPSCTESKNVAKIKKYLKCNRINFVNEKMFNLCINPKTKRKLPFDFFLPDHNMCIEYDGEQHFIQTKYYNTLPAIQFRDFIKDQFCESHGIELVRISYRDNVIDVLDAILK
jgi:hypothetical protein